MPQAEVFFLSGLRTAIGDFGGALKEQPPTTLGAHVARAAIAEAGLAPQDVEHAVFGNVLHTEARDMYVSRVIAVEAGMPTSAPAMTLNRLCGSGLQAIISAAQMIRPRRQPDGARRRRRVDEPLPLHSAGSALGPEDG